MKTSLEKSRDGGVSAVLGMAAELAWVLVIPLAGALLCFLFGMI